MESPKRDRRAAINPLLVTASLFSAKTRGVAQVCPRRSVESFHCDDDGA